MRTILLTGLGAVAILILLLVGPIPENPDYHSFADGRTILGVPNFWNVISNALFLLVALWGLRAIANRAGFVEPWERYAYLILLVGVALVAFGSSYYHLRPSETTLFWDRLPMTVVFMALFATTVGERVNRRVGRLLLAPLLVLGVISLLYWKAMGDLRLYVLVQFYPMLALPLMLALFPPRYTGTAGVWAMIGFYALAKAFEFGDRWIWQFGALVSGHTLKHTAGAVAMLCYVQTMAHRTRMSRQ